MRRKKRINASSNRNLARETERGSNPPENNGGDTIQRTPPNSFRSLSNEQ
jgi:hypothetical protein